MHQRKSKEHPISKIKLRQKKKKSTALLKILLSSVLGLPMLIPIIIFFSINTAVASQYNFPVALPGCDDTCGSVKIPFPFGTSENCYLNSWFFINCSSEGNPLRPTPYIRGGDAEVSNITLDGQIHSYSTVARDCYDPNRNNVKMDNYRRGGFFAAEFSINDTLNEFVAVGCDTVAYLLGYYSDDKTYRTGCVSWCRDPTEIVNGSCSGVGCCQVGIAKWARNTRILLYSFSNHTNVSYFNPCSYAFLIQKGLFNFSLSNLTVITEGRRRTPIVLDWAVGNRSCDAAKMSGDYACKQRTSCYEPFKDSGYRSGYRCACKEGYDGNPYLEEGCQNINECDRGTHNCSKNALCEDSIGSFKCFCREGYRDDGQGGCERKNSTPKTVKLTLSIIGSIMILLLLGSWMYIGYKRRSSMRKREKFFQENGGFILKQRLAGQGGTQISVKIYSIDELEKATNNFHESAILGQGGYGTVYKGLFAENNIVAIKKSKIMNHDQVEQFINEVIILSQINHKNVVKLLGCCLETEVPLLVYEFINNGTLSQHIHDGFKARALSWEIRLKIAADTAGVLSYLHSAASQPIIHRDVKSMNILLDSNYTAKVSDFGASRLVPTDQDQLSTMVQGTWGYLDPEYMHTSQLTEKSDVYSFGVVLAELLTSRKALSFEGAEKERSLVNLFVLSMKENCLFEILDKNILSGDNMEQIREVALIATRCLKMTGEARPTMKEVAMELEGLRILCRHSWIETQDNGEELESLLGGPSIPIPTEFSQAATDSSGYDSIRNHTALGVSDGR